MPALGVTPTQTVGPFFSPALLRDPWNVMTTDTTRGQRIRVEGRVIDGAGAMVPAHYPPSAAGQPHDPRPGRCARALGEAPGAQSSARRRDLSDGTIAALEPKVSIARSARPGGHRLSPRALGLALGVRVGVDAR